MIQNEGEELETRLKREEVARECASCEYLSANTKNGALAGTHAMASLNCNADHSTQWRHCSAQEYPGTVPGLRTWPFQVKFDMLALPVDPHSACDVIRTRLHFPNER